MAVARIDAFNSRFPSRGQHRFRAHDCYHLNSYLSQIRNYFVLPLTSADHHSRFAWRDAVQANQALNGTRKHHADQVIVREQDRCLVSTGSYNHPACPQMNQPLSGIGMRARLDDPQQVSFVQSKAVTTLHDLHIGKLAHL